MILYNNYLENKSFSINLENNLTIMFLINMENNRTTREFMCGKDPFYDMAIVLEKSDSNQISFYCGNGERINYKHAKYYAYTGRLPYNKYTHICFIRNGDCICVYINGKLDNIYYHSIKNIVHKSGLFYIGKSNYSYLSNLSQNTKFFKLFNYTITNESLNKLVNYNNFSFYFEDKCSKLLNIFNCSTLNYRFSKDNITYIYNDNLFLQYNNSYYNEIVRLNNLSLNSIQKLIDNDTTLIFDEKLIDNTNIDNIIYNIISWQFGMYQDEYPKVLLTSTIGFWSKRECSLLEKYIGKGLSYKNSNNEISYNYGSLQDGTGIYIKLIIDYYLKYKNTASSLINDCLTSINIFIDYLNEMIYDNGGIPEYYPLQGGHFDNICLNDGAFINYLRCCDFILDTEIKYEINTDKINLLQNNYNKAFDCILNLQITINGVKTIWAQQYDKNTLQPTSARSFEQVSLCSLESAQLLIYLMSLPNPSEKIKNSIICGCDWFTNHMITNYVQNITNIKPNIVQNQNIVRNLYSRYYSINNESPIFLDRDNNTYTLNNFNNFIETVATEQNLIGYTWLGCWGDYLLEIYEYWKTFNLQINQ